MVKPYNENYNQAVHIAVGPKFHNSSLIDKLIKEINNCIEPVFKAKLQSHWIEKKSRSKYIDAFMTMGFNYHNAYKDEVPDLSKIDGEWTLLRE